MDLTRHRHRRTSIRVLGAVSFVLLAACAAPPPPHGGTTSTTTTTAQTTTTVTPSTTTTVASTTTVPPSTTTTSAPVPPGPDGSIERVTDSIGGEGGGESYGPTISGDGRRVAFWSTAWDLVPDDPNAVADVYVWDATTDTTVRITNSRSYHDSVAPVISADGRRVAFTSAAGDLTPGDLNGTEDVFVWDATTGTTTRITDGDGGSRAHAISADGRRVVFGTGALFVWDATTNTTTRVSDDWYVTHASISADGRYVAYAAEPWDLPDETNGVDDVFVWDAATGTTTRVTDGDDVSTYPDISADGRYIAFSSSASNLVPGETSEPGMFVWDATTSSITRATDGGIPRISGDGRYIAFSSSASDLVPGDTNGVADVFVWDATTGTTARVTDGNGDSHAPAISADGNSITFSSKASNLADGDPDAVQDVFVWRRRN